MVMTAYPTDDHPLWKKHVAFLDRVSAEEELQLNDVPVPPDDLPVWFYHKCISTLTEPWVRHPATEAEMFYLGVLIGRLTTAAELTGELRERRRSRRR